MRHLVIAAVAAILMAAASTVALATAYDIQLGSGLGSLQHRDAYYLGVNFSLPQDEQILSATLTLTDIYSAGKTPNWLFLSLLDNQPGKHAPALRKYKDRQPGPIDFFDTWKYGETDLVTFMELGKTPTLLTYDFTPLQLTALEGYLADGRFAIGIDPDCRFRDRGISLTIITGIPGGGGGIGNIVPESPAIIMALAGLLPALGAIQRLRHKR